MNGSLSVHAVSRQTRGMYKCHVSNTEGEITYITVLKVIGKSSFYSLNTPKKIKDLRAFILKCQPFAFLTGCRHLAVLLQHSNKTGSNENMSSICIPIVL